MGVGHRIAWRFALDGPGQPGTASKSSDPVGLFCDRAGASVSVPVGNILPLEAAGTRNWSSVFLSGSVSTWDAW